MATANEPQMMSREELKEILDSDRDFHLIEVLPEENFEEFHLPGAINIPVDELRTRMAGVVPNKDATIVVYCANPACTASDRAADLLAKMGYTDVHDYRGGKEHWTEGGHPVERRAAEAV